MKEPASNRQKKILRLFGIKKFSPEISKGAAGWEIGQLFADKNKEIRWEKYKHLTGDYGQETDQLRDFDPKELDAHELPPEQPRTRSKNLDDDGISNHYKSHGGPYDNPPPEIEFAESVFAFTGIFSFGDRKECRQAVIEKGGKFEDDVKTSVDYLVVGGKGNPTWKHGNYGVKIGKAINFRINHGKLAIVSESDWKAALDGENKTPKV